MKFVLANDTTPWTATKKAMLLLVTVPLRLALLIAIIVWARRSSADRRAPRGVSGVQVRSAADHPRQPALKNAPDAAYQSL
jgi:hypothetical protein